MIDISLLMKTYEYRFCFLFNHRGPWRLCGRNGRHFTNVSFTGLSYYSLHRHRGDKTESNTHDTHRLRPSICIYPYPYHSAIVPYIYIYNIIIHVLLLTSLPS